jgi:hypothetical protein
LTAFRTTADVPISEDASVPKSRWDAFITLIWCLVVWGPPPLRLEARGTDVALDNPFNLDGAATFQVATLLAAACLTIYTWGRLRKSQSHLLRDILAGPHLWYAAFAALAVVSSLYSVRPAYTLFFATRLCVAVFLPALLVARWGQRTAVHALRCLGTVAVFQATGLLLAALLIPDVAGQDIPGVGYRLTGGSIVDFGSSGALVALFVFVRLLGRPYPQQRVWLVTLGCLGLLELYLSRTRGIWGQLLVGCCLATAILRPRLLKVLGPLTLCLVLSIVALGWADPVVEYLRRGQSDEEISTGSGRLQAFNALVLFWANHPVLGGGYAAGSRVALMYFPEESGLGIGAAHDIASRSLSDLGVLGAAIVLGLYLSAIRRLVLAVVHARDVSAPVLPAVATAVGYIAMQLVQGCEGGGIADPMPGVAAAFLVLSTAAYLGVGSRIQEPTPSADGSHAERLTA